MSFVDFTDHWLGPPYTQPGLPVITNPYLISSRSTGAAVVKQGWLESDNFLTGTSGWQINADGDVEFNSGTFRGTLEAGEIHIPDEVTVNSFHVETDGSGWVGQTTAARTSAPFQWTAGGAVTVDSLSVNTDVTLAGGKFATDVAGERRVELDDSNIAVGGPGGVGLAFYSDNASETRPGFAGMYDNTSGTMGIWGPIITGNLSFGGRGPSILLDSGSPSVENSITMVADDFVIIANSGYSAGNRLVSISNLDVDINPGTLTFTNSRGIGAIQGTYGSVGTRGSSGGWSGYSIDGGIVLMRDANNNAGLYNDTLNEWIFYYQSAGYFEINAGGVLHTRFDKVGVGAGAANNTTWQWQDNGDQRIYIGCYWESGVGQYARVRATNNAGALNTLHLESATMNVLIDDVQEMRFDSNRLYFTQGASFDTYIDWATDDHLNFYVGGKLGFGIDETGLNLYANNVEELRVTANRLSFWQGGTDDTYIEWATGDRLSIVCGGAQMMELVETTANYITFNAKVFVPNLNGVGDSTKPHVHRWNTGSNELYYDTSTKRVKRNIKNHDVLGHVEVLPRLGKTYNAIYDGKTQDKLLFGALAEDVAEISPLLVGYMRFKGKTAEITEDKRYKESPSNIALQPMLIALWDRVAQLEEHIYA